MWTEPKQLVLLSSFFEQASSSPEKISDEVFLEQIGAAHWPTNSWSYAEASLCIVAPACVLRPKLTKQLLIHPIEALLASGLEEPQEIIEFGLKLCKKKNPYVQPSAAGQRWLESEWPRLESLVTEILNHLEDKSG